MRIQGGSGGRRPSRGFAWGFASQGFSSATNLGLSFLAGRLLGPGGLGVVAIVFLAYLTALGFQRALVSEPLVTASTALPVGTLPRPTGRGLTVSILGALVAAAITGLAGLAIGGEIGRGLVLVVPWLPFLLIQDYWRSVLFRDGRASAAALNDGVWLLVMGVTAPLAWAWPSLWAVVAVWGMGGVAGALLGFAQSRVVVRGIRRSVAWWRAEMWPLGKWLAATSLGYAILSNVTVLVLVYLVGTSDFGGLRAVNTIFAPITFVGAALALPGLPALARARAGSESVALNLAAKISGGSALVTICYVGVLALGGSSILADVFGGSFRTYGYLIWPIAVGQVVSALSVGFAIVLKAQRRGSAILVTTLVGSATSLAFMAGLGSVYGLTGVAWGGSAAALVSLLFTTIVAVRVERARVGGGSPEVVSPAVRSGETGEPLRQIGS